MTKPIKYLIVGFAGLILCALCIGGGYYVGYERAVTTSSAIVIGRSALDNRVVLKDLESKNIDAAKKYLNSILDEEIMELFIYQAESSDLELRKRTLRTLAIIAEHRQKYPFITKDRDNPEVDQKVREILGQSLNERHKE